MDFSRSIPEDDIHIRHTCMIKQDSCINRYFVTKATDIKTIFFKSPYKMHVFVKKFTCFNHIFGIFSTLHCTLTLFQWAGIKKLNFEHAFQPYTYTLRGGGQQAIPRFRPPRVRLSCSVEHPIIDEQYLHNLNKMSAYYILKIMNFCTYFKKKIFDNKHF